MSPWSVAISTSLSRNWGPRLRPVGVLNSCRRVSRAAGFTESPNSEVPTDMGLPNGAPPEAGLGWSWTVSKHIQHYQIIIRWLSDYYNQICFWCARLKRHPLRKRRDHTGLENCMKTQCNLWPWRPIVLVCCSISFLFVVAKCRPLARSCVQNVGYKKRQRTSKSSNSFDVDHTRNRTCRCLTCFHGLQNF